IDDGGRILVLGLGWDDDDVIARYNADGTLDETFGVDGLVTLDPKMSMATMVIDESKRIVVGGSFQSQPLAAKNFAVLRHHMDGAIDTSFGDGGLALSSATGGIGLDVAVDQSGRILLTGSASGDWGV